MKSLGVFLVFCLAASQVTAASIDSETPTNLEARVNSIVQEVEQIAIDAARTLAHQLDEIVLDPIHEVENAVQSIEERRDEHADCVSAEDERVASVVDSMHNEMASCGSTAARTSAGIASDVNAATQQLLFGGYDVLSTYQKCKNYKNPVLKNSCYARLSIKATIYVTAAPKSIRTITNATNERVPAVFVDADICTHAAAARAVSELGQVNASIDVCIAQ